MSENNIGPAVNNVYKYTHEGTEYGVICMQKMEPVSTDDGFNEEFVDAVRVKIARMNSMGILHNNLFKKKVMKLNGEPYIIGYGMALYMPKVPNELAKLDNMYCGECKTNMERGDYKTLLSAYESDDSFLNYIGKTNLIKYINRLFSNTVPEDISRYTAYVAYKRMSAGILSLFAMKKIFKALNSYRKSMGKRSIKIKRPTKSDILAILKSHKTETLFAILTLRNYMKEKNLRTRHTQSHPRINISDRVVWKSKLKEITHD